MKNQKYWIKKLKTVLLNYKIPVIRLEAGPYQPAGISDLMIRYDLSNIFIEVKASGKLTELQERFLKTFGGCCWYPNRKKNKFTWYNVNRNIAEEIEKILLEINK